jgi:hypothetical protein
VALGINNRSGKLSLFSPLQEVPMKFPVFNRTGDMVYRVHAGAMARMLVLKQATLSDDGRCLQLLDVTGAAAGAELAGRTHTSRGGLLAVIGRSQQYTTSNGRGEVNGFKTIYPEDRSIFSSAVLDCLVS